MSGFLVLYLSAIGIGSLLPLSKNIGFSLIGLRLVLGFLFLPVLIFVFHVLIGLELKFSCHLIAIISLIGLGLVIGTKYQLNNYFSLFSHPISVLPIITLLIVVYNGGIGYMPYSGDEFSAWLSIPKMTFALGEFDVAKMRTPYPDYTPSWFLVLVYSPVLLSNQFDEGAIAIAPLVLHIGAISLIFDVTSKICKVYEIVNTQKAFLISWAFILILLAAESSGQLIARNLLIEPPQIYGYLTITTLLIATKIPDASKKHILQLAGLILAFCYFFKAAALVFVPVFGLSAILFAKDLLKSCQHKSNLNQLMVTFKLSIFLVGPFVVTALFWYLFTNEYHTVTGSPSMLVARNYIDHLEFANFKNITINFNRAVLAYILSYKTLLTIFSMLVLCYGLISKMYRNVSILLISFFISYYFALYWAHLTIFTTEPTAIPRYMRVPIQVIHSSSLLLCFLILANGSNFTELKKWAYQLKLEKFMVGLCLVVTILTVLQISKIHNVIIDLTTRRFQVLPPYTVEILKEANRLKALVNLYGKKIKNIVIINHPKQPDIHKYAWYGLVPRIFGRGLPTTKLLSIRTVPTEKSELDQYNKWRKDFYKLVKIADVIWPLETIDREKQLMSDFNVSEDCKATPKNYFIIRSSKNFNNFYCVKKF